MQVKGHSGVHSYSPEETAAFSEHFNIYLQTGRRPRPPAAHPKVHDGLLLAKFINIAVKDTIDTRALNKPQRGQGAVPVPNQREPDARHRLSAKAIGVKVTNIGASELINGAQNPTIVLGLVWQLVKIHLLNNINLKNHPELVRLLESNEELSDLLKLPPEQLLLRWFNYHLKNAGHPKRITNFSSDVKDSEAYTVLLHQISPQQCDTNALKQTDAAAARPARARQRQAPGREGAHQGGRHRVRQPAPQPHLHRRHLQPGARPGPADEGRDRQGRPDRGRRRRQP